MTRLGGLLLLVFVSLLWTSGAAQQAVVLENRTLRAVLADGRLESLARGLERETVRDRDREYTFRGSESRTLATVGAFRVVSSRDLRDHSDRPTDPRSGDLRHLRAHLRAVSLRRFSGLFAAQHAVIVLRDAAISWYNHRNKCGENGTKSMNFPNGPGLNGTGRSLLSRWLRSAISKAV